MQKPTFISNTNIRQPRGGWDGLGGTIYSLLEQRLPEIKLVDNINPKVSIVSKGISKVLRSTGLKGSFPVFNRARLAETGKIISQSISGETDYLVFHGATPWVGYQPDRPYCAVLDCSFMTYMNVYHDTTRFSRSDINRIMDQERNFFEKAHRVFFTTNWAIDDTRRLYDMAGKNFRRIGQGPSVKTSNSVNSTGPRNQFLFIATDFLGKGGAEVCSSFQEFVETYPEYELVIVGQTPPEEYLNGRNIRFVGFVNKSTPEGLEQLLQLYRESKALVMMTRKDIAPLVVIEAGNEGCLTIANKVTALGEMVKNGETGFLIDNKEGELLAAMKKLAALSENQYMKMRAEARVHLDHHFSWNTIIDTMVSEMTNS